MFQIYNLSVTPLKLLKKDFVLTHYLNKSKCCSFQINFDVKIFRTIARQYAIECQLNYKIKKLCN